MTISVVGPRRSYKALPKAKLSSKKIMFTVWWSAVHLIHIAFWNLAKPLCLRNMLTKLMRCTKNHIACSGISQREGTNFSPRQCLTARCTTNAYQCFKVEWIGLWRFASAIFTWPLASSSSISTIFFQEKCFHSQQETENAFQEFIKSQSMQLQELTNLFLIGKKCVDWNCSYFD